MISELETVYILVKKGDRKKKTYQYLNMITKDIQTHKLDVVTIPLNKNWSIAF